MYSTGSENRRIKDKPIPLRLGYSPDKGDVFEQLAQKFNSLLLCINDQAIALEVVPLEDRELVNSALHGDIEVICPDSMVRIEQIEDNWRQQKPSQFGLIEELTIFAVSPLVIALHPASARRLGYPDKDIGWLDLMLESQENSNFRWVHPHVQSSAGILIALAEFQAAANMDGELIESQLRDAEIRSYVQRLEGKVQQYGPSEMATISYALNEGKWRVDAFVAQERLVLSACKKMGESNRPIIIYPKEGTAWIDHPLALLSREGMTSIIKSAYKKLRDYLLSADAQSLFTNAGFHAAGPHIRSYFSAPSVSPKFLKELHAAAARTLSVPAAPMLKSVATGWYTVKRPAAVYLIVDVSESMEGPKLEEAKKGLLAFLDQFQNLDDAVGLIVFDNEVQNLVPIKPLHVNYTVLKDAINNLHAGGMTALLDAASLAYDLLNKPYHNQPIRAIVAMTDGLENASRTDYSALRIKIVNGNNRGHPVAIFGLAYGKNAHLQLLEDFSRITSATTETGTLTNIKRTYERMSTFI
jgi:Ca-activated chloride channel family protein